VGGIVVVVVVGGTVVVVVVVGGTVVVVVVVVGAGFTVIVTVAWFESLWPSFAMYRKSSIPENAGSGV